VDYKPIETQYRGFRFRSRHEARWAVALTALGVKWEYEKEGYDLDGVWYLPDFWLPDHKIWVEVKANLEDVTEEEQLKARALAVATKRTCVIVGEFITNCLCYHNDPVSDAWRIPAPLDELAGGVGLMFSGKMDADKSCPIYCAVCGDQHVHMNKCEIVPSWMTYDTAGISFWCEQGCSYDLLIGNHKGDGFAEVVNAKMLSDSLVEYLTSGVAWRIAEAFEKAKSARFEHGETPD